VWRAFLHPINNESARLNIYRKKKEEVGSPLASRPAGKRMPPVGT